MYERQQELLNADQLASENILIVGVGAIGRQVALTLSAMGAKNITVCDMDLVDESNVATQGYSPRDIGKKKVAALQESVLSHFGLPITPKESPWNPAEFRQSNHTILFSCVDRMDVRRSLWIHAKRTPSIKYFLDGRMLAEMGHVFCYDRTSIEQYGETLFNDDEAIQGRCTRRGTLYMASILSNMMVGRRALALRGVAAKNKYTFNLIGEMI